MNIISTTVGLSLIGAASPMIMNMAITPVVAQKRAQNFGIAESVAVTYATVNEGKVSLSAAPDGCTVTNLDTYAYSVTCEHGIGKYVQRVTRSFRLAVCDDNDGNNGHGNSNGYDCSNPGGYANNARVFDYATPREFSRHQCPVDDPWGVNGYNKSNSKWLGGACIPAQVWNSAAYYASTPDAWLYDVNNHNGWGHHPDY